MPATLPLVREMARTHSFAVTGPNTSATVTYSLLLRRDDIGCALPRHSAAHAKPVGWPRPRRQPRGGEEAAANVGGANEGSDPSLEAESLHDQVELSIMKIERNVTHEIVLKRRL
jgi:hypothetical protein